MLSISHIVRCAVSKGDSDLGTRCERNPKAWRGIARLNLNKYVDFAGNWSAHKVTALNSTRRLIDLSLNACPQMLQNNHNDFPWTVNTMNRPLLRYWVESIMDITHSTTDSASPSHSNLSLEGYTKDGNPLPFVATETNILQTFKSCVISLLLLRVLAMGLLS